MNETSTRIVAREDRELLPQSEVLKDEVAATADSRANCVEKADEDVSHHAMMLEVGRRPLPDR